MVHNCLAGVVRGSGHEHWRTDLGQAPNF